MLINLKFPKMIKSNIKNKVKNFINYMQITAFLVIPINMK